MKLALLALTVAVPCLWDRDTLRIEAEGAPGIAEVIVGRFDCFPDAYYELRLERIRADLDGPSPALELFDDAAVACDRLGNSDEAIEWMARKRARLDALGETDAFHEYTYLANLGTFHVHRWLKDGNDGEAEGDLVRARDLISAAIALNPDAHFGRERYQRLAIEWLLDPVAAGDSRNGGPEMNQPTLLSRPLSRDLFAGSQNVLEAHGLGDAVEGLAGLVHLGAAWRSAPIWAALAQALSARGDAFLARLASLRLMEVLAEAPERLPYEGFHLDGFLRVTSEGLYDHAKASVDQWYALARPASEAWRSSRLDYLRTRLAQGIHPDDSPDFWRDWRDTSPLPRFPGDGYAEEIGWAGAAFALLAAGLLAYGLRARRAQARALSA